MIDITKSEYCPLCGTPVGPHLLNIRGCPSCPNIKIQYEAMVRTGLYASPLKEMILNYKYHHMQRLDQPLGSILASAIQGQSWCRELDALIPVPVTWFDRLKYRYFPVGLLASCVGKKLSIPALPLLKVRGKKQRQMELPESKRPANVRSVFHLAKHANVKGKTLCIIDDVATTCSTLREVARTLKKGGAGHVYAAVLAKTDPRKSIY
ncbi:MAG: ComF family protein [Planctomycetota bacterium]|nr:MAG: ComF family protein [Planctomycetota bacterium]